MSSSRKSKGFHPAAPTLYLRLAGIFFLVLILSSVILFGGTFYTLYRSLNADDEQYARDRLLSYWARYQATGIEGLMDEFQAESLIFDDRPFFIRLADLENKTLFLSYPEHWESFSILEYLETKKPEELGKKLQIEDPGREFVLEVNTIKLDQDYLLQVGTSSEKREALLGLYRRNFLFFLTFVLVFGLTAGLILASRAVAPIRRLSFTLKEITTTGDLSSRLPNRNTGDEIDELSVSFNRLLDRIEGLVSRMKETLDAVAHDLRTPLTRLRGGAELALQSNDENRREGALSDALEESERILTLLTALMDISEAESGILKLHRVEMQPREALEKLVEIYSFAGADREIDIDLSGSFPATIYADPARFSQAAGNLLDNAVKFSPGKGRIVVSGKVLQDKKVFQLKISNQGPQIKESDLPRIWDRLYRGADTGVSGLGLGLSLVKAVTEAHGGSAMVENIAGETGVCFTIEFPLEHK